MKTNAGYNILRTECYSRERGIALGISEKEVAKYVTWEFVIKENEKNYFWGHYFDNITTAYADYHKRLAERYEDIPF